QWHQKFDEVVLSNSYLLNQADKCVYSKCDETGKGVIIFLYVDDILIFGTDQVHVDLTKEFLSSRFSMKDMGEADVILVSTHMDTSEKLMPNNGQAVSQLKYSRMIGCLMYTMTCTRPDIAFAMGKLRGILVTLVLSTVLEGYTDASWISNTEYNSSISGWVFLLAAGKEVEWLKNLLLEIPLHRMIPELITNRVVSIEFVRSQENLANYLMKGLARDLVIKSAKGMGLKSN
ncbi:zinc finger, CCHC-type containing protein, partial [Tanacetum coccineum]